MSDLPATQSTGQSIVALGELQQFVSITIGNQLFGIPVLQVHDILGPSE